MPISDPARHALEKAVDLNADGARLLLAILRTAPGAVKCKPSDTFGPLGMMVTEFAQTPPPQGAHGLMRPALPFGLHRAAARFQREWLAGKFTKGELADELERCLQRLGEEVPTLGGGWHLVGRRRLDSLAGLFPARTPEGG